MCTKLCNLRTYPVVSVNLEVGERYIQVWTPDNSRMPLLNIITIWGERFEPLIGGGGTAFPCVPLHFNYCMIILQCANVDNLICVVVVTHCNVSVKLEVGESYI